MQVLQEQLNRVASLSDADQIDRRVIRQLLVTYYQRPQSSHDILNLIASMLVSELHVALVARVHDRRFAVILRGDGD